MENKIESCFLLFCCRDVMFKKINLKTCNHEISPRGHSSQSGEVEMHTNNWHLDELG